MNKKRILTVKKVLFYLFLILVIGLFVFTQLLKPNKTPNSFKNTGYFGNALFYDAMVKLGYETAYSIRPLEKSNKDKLVILNASAANHPLTEGEYALIFEYVRRGGKLLLLLDQETLDFGQTPNDGTFQEVLNENNHGPFRKWTVESSGIFMVGSINTLSNTMVSTQREIVYGALEMIHSYAVKGVDFNEYYLYLSDGNRSLWKELPVGVKFVLVQLLLVFLLYIAMKGKRFGAAMKFYEEAEPDENQYAKAVGSLYYQTGHWEVLMDAYYNHLIHKIYRKHLLYADIGEENWPTVFEKHKEKDYKTALKVQVFMKAFREGNLQKSSKRNTKKKYKEILVAIQNLEKSLEQ